MMGDQQWQRMLLPLRKQLGMSWSVRQVVLHGQPLLCKGPPACAGVGVHAVTADAAVPDGTAQQVCWAAAARRDCVSRLRVHFALRCACWRRVAAGAPPRGNPAPASHCGDLATGNHRLWPLGTARKMNAGYPSQACIMIVPCRQGSKLTLRRCIAP